MTAPARPTVVVFDLDGTLVDSDVALTTPFLQLGVDPADLPPLGLPLGEACRLVGVHVPDYLDRYDPEAVEPFDGVVELLASLGEFSICSNKSRESGLRELARFGWAPVAAWFSEDFGGAPKQLAPVLDVLAVEATEVLFVGDTAHDRACARRVGATFALAGWNARATPEPGDAVLHHPADVLELLS